MEPRRVFGLDFSGAADAGRRSWLAAGVATGGRVSVAKVFPVSALPGSGPRPEEAFAALCAFIASLGEAAVGCDFSFGLPAGLVAEAEWRAFALGFSSRHPTPEAMREACRTASPGRELRRQTDREARSPFSPLNLRAYRQTWHGIASVLAPLLAAGAATAFPMEAPRAGVPVLVEACPASTLKRLGLSRPYKGRGAAYREARARILSALEAAGLLGFSSEAPREAALSQPGGDALDAALCALGAARAACEPWSPPQAPYSVEGRIFF